MTGRSLASMPPRNGGFPKRSPGPSITRYFHKDHLGSISVITDELGAVVERSSYDAPWRQ